MNALYTTQLANEHLAVYPDRIVQTIKGTGKEITIKLDHIAVFDTGFWFVGKVKIKTTSGEEYTLHMWPNVKKQFVQAVDEARG